MQFGVNTFIWTANFDGSSLPLLPAIKAGGFDSFEVPIFRPGEFAAREIRRGAEEHGLQPTVCTVLVDGLNTIGADADVRRRTIAHWKDCIRAVAEAGAHLLVGPLYSPVGWLPGRRRTGDEWQWAVECFQALGDTLAAHDVALAIEPLNRFETFFLNTAADGVRLCQEVGHPSVGLLIDTFHANIEEKDVASAYRTAAPYLKHVHTCENDRGTPGSGHVDWPGVFQALRDIGYDACLTIESFGFALGEISAAASIWRDLAPTPDSIAFEGVTFLRRNMA
ncbi:MAG: sugar phosphate isomerase/epimerase [Acidobacteria bacterium]|nr:sugar phosphate isomerase/epimerase [Acidobacteriota bacterium]